MLFLGDIIPYTGLELNVKDCLRITCLGKNSDEMQFVYPGTYLLCNENQNQNLTQALCSKKDSQDWFHDSLLQIYVANLINKTSSLSKCRLNKRLFFRSTNEFCNENSTCCLSRNVTKLFGKTSCRMDYFCPKVSMYKEEAVIKWSTGAVKTFIGFEFFVGFFAILGNFVVILNSVHVLKRKTVGVEKEIKVYNLLLLNLAVADFLMGLYVVGITSGGLTFLLKQMNTDRNGNQQCSWIRNSVCSVLGTINFLSSQASVTALVAITGLRLYGVYFPFRRMNLKKITTATVATWFFWIAIACFPIFTFEPFKTSFTDTVQFESGQKLRFTHLEFLLQKIIAEINRFCGLEKDNNYKLNGNLQWETLLLVAKKLKLFTDNDIKGLTYISYYNVQCLCTPKFLVHHFYKYFFFNILILAFNSASCIFIFFSQLAIAKKSFLAPDLKKKGCSNWIGFFDYAPRSKNPMQKRRDTENRKLRRRLFLVVVTDFLCWIPLSFISVIYAIIFALRTSKRGVCLFLASKQYVEEWFYVLAIIIIPLNSIINPFIYSYSAKERIKRFFMTCCNRITKRSNLQNPSFSSSNAKSSSSTASINTTSTNATMVTSSV